MKSIHYQWIAKSGYFGLLLLVPLWHLWLSPPGLNINPWLITAIWFIPLLLPLKGILQGTPYTYAWSSFVALFYLLHSLVILLSAENSGEFRLATIELLFTFLFITWNIYFAKYRGRELGLSIRRNKEK